MSEEERDTPLGPEQGERIVWGAVREAVEPLSQTAQRWSPLLGVFAIASGAFGV